MKKIIVYFILCVFVFSNVVNAQPIGFDDIQSHWAKTDILKLSEEGIVSGYVDGTFKPENNITIAEFIKMIIVAGDYTLVREGSKIYPDFYMATAKNKNIIPINFEKDLNTYLTRYEMIEFISNFIGTEDVKVNRNIFEDLDKNNKDKVLKLVNLKIINGYEDKTFRGENNVTRAEAASVLCKALNAREKLISKRKYTISERTDLSNYKEKVSDSKIANKKMYSLKPFYEVSKDKLKIYDSGRYSNLNGYEVSDTKIDISKIIKIIKKVVNEKAYVGVIYIPSKYTINELKIIYGDDELKVLCGEYDFAFNYYENKTYNLASKSLHDEFSDNCYLRIEVIKLWDDYIDYKNGIYVDEYKKEKLLEALKVEFGSSAEKILEYMIEKNIQYVTNKENYEERVEQKIFGKYIVNFYQKENGVPQFYIERK